MRHRIKSVSSYWAEEKTKLSGMTRKAALSYIWMYYKLWIVGAIVFVGLAIYFGKILFYPVPDTELKITFINFYDDVSSGSSFYENFIEELPEKPEEGSIFFDNGAFFNLANSADFRNAYYQKVVAGLETSDIDGIICQYDNLMGIAKGGRFMDLRDERVSGFCEQYQDKFLYYESEDGKIPVAIDISDSKVWMGMNSYAQSCYLGISAKTQRFEKLEQFLSYLNET